MALQSTLSKQQRMLRVCNGSLSKIFREQNAIADFMASMAMQENSDHHFVFENSPSRLKAMVELEMIGLPYVRP